MRKNPSAPTQRIGEKNGTKRHLLVVSGANRHDSVSLDVLLKNRVIAPKKEDTPRNLCLDAAYVGKEDTVLSNGFIPHIRPRGEEKQLIE